MNIKQKKGEFLSVFISHRHKDKDIADIFREAIENWSNCEIIVYQSSNAQTASRIGDKLDDSIKTALARVNIVLLIYTAADHDWAWCMYECGLAQDPATMKTRIVVFHMSDNPPEPLRHLITVPMSKEDIKKFTYNFHKDPLFFPRYEKPFAPNLEDDQIEQRSNELYKKLLKVLPDTTLKESLRYDQITLALDLEHVEQVKCVDQKADYKKALKCANELITQNCVVKEFFGEPHAYFNFEKLTENLKFNNLVARWRKESKYPKLNWDDELYEEITKAMLNRKEGAISTPFNSVEPESTDWFLPIISSYRVVPDDKIMEFFILLCRIQSKVAEIMIRRDQ